MPGVYIESVVANFDGFVDVMLCHWPGLQTLKPTDPKNISERHTFYNQMESYKQKGLIGEIGVSNFNHSHLHQLLQNCDEKPLYNQFEVHPLYIEKETIKACRDNNIKIMAYTPLA